VKHSLISPDSIHLWHCALEKKIAPRLQERCLKLLSPEEIARMDSFRFEKHRTQFLISHAFLRIVLSRYLGCSPASIAYSLNEYGKPFIRSGTEQAVISFNLSHTDGLACCAIAKEGDIGVDVECIERLGTWDEIAKHFFSAAELASIMTVEEDEARMERFCRIWILKEAFIKAKGMGLSLPLDLFEFSFPQDERIAISFSPEFEESPECWNFSLVDMTEGHRAAIAYKPLSSDISRRYPVSCFPVPDLQKFFDES
jgi:4'-phosphopantetheinyl transferase